MPDSALTIVLVDPDPHARALLAHHLAPTRANIIQESDGPTGLNSASTWRAALIVSELYLPTGSDECLIQALRRDPLLKKSRVVAHTHRNMAVDREWAMRAGADAYLIKPTRAQRLLYVATRLLGERRPGSTVSTLPMIRRDSLDSALQEIEAGGLPETSTIVFGRQWWESQPEPVRKRFRARARKLRVNLRSDSMLSHHFVELRGDVRDAVALSTERPESPYRR